MNCSVVVFGCKNYRDVAESFFRNIPSKNLEIFSNCYFCSDFFLEEIDVNQIVISEDISWSKRVALSLEKVQSDFIFFFLDDYFVEQTLNLSDYKNILNYCEFNNINYCRLINNPKNIDFGSYNNLPVTSYSINLQPAIWNRSFLIKILHKIDSTPWNAEVSLHRYFIKNNDFYDAAIGYSLINNYINGVIKGEWARDIPYYLKGHSNRNMMSVFDWYFYRIKSFFSNTLNDKSKGLLKLILSKFGIRFFS